MMPKGDKERTYRLVVRKPHLIRRVFSAVVLLASGAVYGCDARDPSLPQEIPHVAIYEGQHISLRCGVKISADLSWDGSIDEFRPEAVHFDGIWGEGAEPLEAIPPIWIPDGEGGVGGVAIVRTPTVDTIDGEKGTAFTAQGVNCTADLLAPAK